MTTSDMELAAKYLRTNDVGDAAGEACVRIATALEIRVVNNRMKIISAAGKEPPDRSKPRMMSHEDRCKAQSERREAEYRSWAGFNDPR